MSDVMWNGKWHPFAEQFPMLSEQDLRDMADSIRETGQLNPCVMTPDGLGIDGRNRVAACRIAGVEPSWAVNDGDPMSIIIAANVHHRFLTTGQRAMAVAVDLADKGMRQDNGRWKKGSIPDPDDIVSSNNIDTWRGAMNRAGAILDSAPTLADKVLSGTLALDAAYKQATEQRKAEQEHAEKTAQLPADLSALVDNGVRDLDEAVAEAKARETVARIDKIRDSDGDPPPSFADRVETGDLAWDESATLAEQWEQDRFESIQRDRERIGNVIKGGWSALRRIAAKPDHPYTQDLLEGVGDGTRELIQETITAIKKEAPQW